MTIPPAKPPGDYAPAARRLVAMFLLFAASVVLAFWSWQQSFMSRPRALWELSRMPPPVMLPMPVQGVAATRIADTFGAPRGTTRAHAGLDIFATRGTPILSTTRGVVIAVRESGLGGKQVWVLGPARERHYYAHLDDWRQGLSVGEVVSPGDVLGIVGDTGNARGTPAHLHYAIHGAEGAYDPLPLLRAGAPARRSKHTDGFLATLARKPRLVALRGTSHAHRPLAAQHHLVRQLLVPARCGRCASHVHAAHRDATIRRNDACRG